MQLSQIFNILWRRRWIVLITLLASLAVATVITMLIPPIYQTTAVLRVLTPGTGLDNSGSWVNTQLADRLTATYLEVLQSGSVFDALANRLGLSSRTDLPDIEIEVMSGTELLEIRALDRDPRIVNEFAQMLVESPYLLFGDRRPAIQALRERRLESETRLDDLRQQYEDLFESANPNRNTADTLRQQITLEEQNYAELTRQYTQATLLIENQATAVTLVQPAEVPEEPIRPVPLLNLAIGVAAGLFGGLALAFFFENLDNVLYSSSQIENVSGTRIVGQIPRGKRSRGVTLRMNEPEVLEGYRWLRANVVSPNSGYKTLLGVSPDSEEGKSSVIANLGASIAQSGRSVLIVDANLRNPVLHNTFGASGDVGLGEILLGNAQVNDVLQKLGDYEFYFLAAGSSPEAADLLGSERSRTLLRQFGRQFDVVLLDSPSAATYSDAVALSALADGVLVVVERTKTTEENLQSIINSLRSMGATIAGVVVNRAERRAVGAPSRPSRRAPAAPMRVAAPESNGKTQPQPEPVRATDDL